MKFPYSKIRQPSGNTFLGNSTLRPIIPIQILYKGKSIKYAALIDSGADFCIFDAEIGEYLGINIKSGGKIKFSGIQDKSSSVAYFHEIMLNIGGWEMSTKVAFSYDISKNGSGILGQKGFFDLFTIKFDLSKEEIELRNQGIGS